MIEFFFGIGVALFIMYLLFNSIKRIKEKNRVNRVIMRNEEVPEWMAYYKYIRNGIGEDANEEEKVESEEVIKLFSSRDALKEEKK